MSAPMPSPSFESRDSVLYEYTDAGAVDDTVDPTRDESARRHLSQRFAIAAITAPLPQDLSRLLALVREREQFCRGAKDFIGLARCLGNQAIMRGLEGHPDAALALSQQVEQLSRQLDDQEGLAFALAHQAWLLAGALGKPAEGLPLAERAHELANGRCWTRLAAFIELVLERIRAQLRAA